MDLTKCHPTKSGNVITPKGRGAYVAFFTPRGIKGDPNSKAKYGGTLLLPANADLDGLKTAAQEAVKAKWSTKPAKLKSPFLKTEDHVHNFVKEDDEDARAKFCKEFPVLIRCSSDQRPDILFGNSEKCDEEAEAYSGRFMRFSVRAYAWEHPANGKGVSFGLQNVQLLDHADRFAGGRAKAEDEFEAVKTSEGGAKSGDGSTDDFLN
jgi:hypothetical protein